jgi:UDP-glucuronate 4-epimerase
VFDQYKIKYVVNLAAQAGVRYSIEKPEKYFDSNLSGFFNLINLCKIHHVSHFVYASTSSVYGDQKKFPVKETFNTDNPLSFYAATKKCNEIIAYSFSNIYRLPTTGLRFFTVYGPYGRPDMALFKFANLLKKNKKIKLFNNGNHERDFTYISDIVEGIVKILEKPSTKKIPHEIYNIGGNKSYKLKDFITLIEKNLNKKAKFIKYPLQQGDVRKTQASSSKLDKLVNKKKYIKLDLGIKKFFEWYNNQR